jgi:hypothetical protein
MIISEELKRNNIAEYVLYMWQTEDLLRSFDFDIEKIDSEIVQKYDLDDSIKESILNWNKGLIQMMDIENIKKSGHLQVITNVVNDMNDLHLWLLNQPSEKKYKSYYEEAKPNILALAAKMQGKAVNEIDICLHGLYAVMLLKLQKKEISPETVSSINTFRNLIAYLAAKYHDREKNPDNYYE